jgi:seryl-tRNA synthetase
MLDVQMLRADPNAFDHALARRGLPPAAERFLALDKALRAAVGALETLQAARKKGPIDKTTLQEAVAAEAAARDAWNTAWLLVPNTPLPEVPDGKDQAANVEIHRWAPACKTTDATAALEHHNVPGVAALLDAETGLKLAGPRQTVLHGPLARLHRALAQWMLDLHVDTHGLRETWVPVLAKGDALRGTGHLPKFAEDAYQLAGQDSWLIPTAEVPLTYMAGHMIHEAAALPVRLVAHSGCFRAEAGAGGRDGAGLLRRHQFEKVEMVTWCTPEQAEAEHARMLAQAKAVLEGLELPYRVIELCTGDMGFASEFTYDVEVWMPGQHTYREIASISRCGTFQARRMAARYRPTPGAKPAFLHTLNGSGVAVGRALAAVVENNQRADGGVDIPKALQTYCGGRTAIAPDGTWA